MTHYLSAGVRGFILPMYPPGTIPEGVAWGAVEGSALSGLLKRLEDARAAAEETLREADLLINSHARDFGHLWKQICGTAEQWASTPEAIVLGLLRFSRDVRSRATEVSKSCGLSKDIIMNKLPAITVCQFPPPPPAIKWISCPIAPESDCACNSS
jgi:hypothetical protein